MRKLIPFVALVFVWLWQANVIPPGDEIMTAGPPTVVARAKPSGSDRVMRVDEVCERAHAIVAHGTGRRGS